MKWSARRSDRKRCERNRELDINIIHPKYKKSSPARRGLLHPLSHSSAKAFKRAPLARSGFALPRLAAMTFPTRKERTASLPLW